MITFPKDDSTPASSKDAAFATSAQTMLNRTLAETDPQERYYRLRATQTVLDYGLRNNLAPQAMQGMRQQFAPHYDTLEAKQALLNELVAAARTEPDYAKRVK